MHSFKTIRLLYGTVEGSSFCLSYIPAGLLSSCIDTNQGNLKAGVSR